MPRGETGLSGLVVEVLCDTGSDEHPAWTSGSGFVVAPETVLTAAHILGRADTCKVRVRVRGAEYPAAVALLGDDGIDLAVLTVAGLAAGAVPLQYGVVNRMRAAVVGDCWAIGFPRYKERRAGKQRVSLTAQVNGEIPTGENLGTELLTLRVTATPRSLPQEPGGSEWSGISGAAVFSGNILIGLVTEHHRPEGSQALGVVPLTALDARADADRWWQRLGVSRGDFVRLPCPLALGDYLRERVAELAGGELLDRAEELAHLKAFATGQEPVAWLVGRPWAGKTTLVAHFLRTPPENVDCVAFFVSRRAGEADASAFLRTVSEQLAALLGVTPDRLGSRDVFRSLWQQAAARAGRLSRHLLLVVDGLDEDLGPLGGQPSVASLLPPQATEYIHLLVTSRPQPDLPADVIDHPLTSAAKIALAPSPRALALARRASFDLSALLGQGDSDAAGEQVLGVLIAAAGPVAADDILSVLRESGLEVRRPRIERLLGQEVARLLDQHTAGPGARYIFAHESLRESAQAALGDAEVSRLRGCIHRWADQFRADRWTSQPPGYLLDSYPGMVAATDPERLVSLYSDIGYVGMAVASLGVDRISNDLWRAQVTCPDEPLFSRLSLILRRESHTLGPREGSTQAGVVRALCMQALESRDGELAGLAADWLNAGPSPAAVPRWTAAYVPLALTRTLSGHAKPVTMVEFHPGSDTATSADASGRTVVWDLATGARLSVSQEKPGHDISRAPVRATSADGEAAIIGDLDGVVWTEQGQQRTRCSHAHYQRVWSVAITEDGSRGVSGGLDGTVRVFDLPDGRQTHLFRQPGEGVRAVAISGSRVLSGATDGTICLWELDGEHPDSFGQLADEVRDVPQYFGPLVWNLRQARPVGIGHFPPDAHGPHWSRTIWGTWGGPLLGDDLDVRGPLPVDPPRHNGPVLFVAIDARRQMIVSAGADGTIRTRNLWSGTRGAIWGSATGLVEVHDDMLIFLREEPGPSSSRRDRILRRSAGQWDSAPMAPAAMAVNQRGTRVITGSDDWHVRMWDLTRGRLPLHDNPSWHTSAVRAVALAPRGDRAATIDEAGHLKLWSIRRGTPYSEQTLPARATAAISGNMSHVITLRDGDIHVWPVTTDTVHSHKVKDRVDSGRTVALSGDGMIALADSGDRELLVWSVPDGKLRHRADGLLGPVRSITVDAAGSYAATVSAAGIIQIWQLADGTCLIRLEAPRPVTALALASGGPIPGIALVLGTDSGALSAYQIMPNRQPPRSRSLSSRIRRPQFTRTGSHAALRHGSDPSSSPRFKGSGQMIFT